MNKNEVGQYHFVYRGDYEFERVMVSYRRRLLIERLTLHRPTVIVEIGCGSELLYRGWLKEGGSADCWVIIEPVAQFAEVARSSGLTNLHVFSDFFENVVDQVRNVLPRHPDMVICSGLLHEVPSVKTLLAAIQALMGDTTLVHINVPNSESLHRRLAKSMGLIADTKALSSRNINLLQHRVYDMMTLKEDLADSGLRVVEEGGYLIKPFTHAQMQQLIPLLGESVMDGLHQLGRELPDLASEIFVEARRDGGV